MDRSSIQKKKWSEKLQEKGKFDQKVENQGGGRIALVQEAPLPFSEAIR